jgi:hypothetical protein
MGNMPSLTGCEPQDQEAISGASVLDAGSREDSSQPETGEPQKPGLWESVLKELAMRPWLQVLGSYRPEEDLPSARDLYREAEKVYEEHRRGDISDDRYYLYTCGVLAQAERSCLILLRVREVEQATSFFAMLQSECKGLSNEGCKLEIKVNLIEGHPDFELEFTYVLEESLYLYLQVLWSLLERVPV